VQPTLPPDDTVPVTNAESLPGATFFLPRQCRDAALRRPVPGAQRRHSSSSTFTRVNP